MHILDSTHFTLITPEHPHIARGDGGHLIINPKVVVVDRTLLARAPAIELMKLTMVCGEALTAVLTQRGVAIGRINYQDNGNWRHELHVHVYGRARAAWLQPYGQPLRLAPTAAAFKAEMGNLEPLNAGDVAALKTQIERLLATEKYRAF